MGLNPSEFAQIDTMFLFIWLSFVICSVDENDKDCVALSQERVFSDVISLPVERLKNCSHGENCYKMRHPSNEFDPSIDICEHCQCCAAFESLLAPNNCLFFAFNRLCSNVQRHCLPIECHEDVLSNWILRLGKWTS